LRRRHEPGAGGQCPSEPRHATPHGAVAAEERCWTERSATNGRVGVASPDSGSPFVSHWPAASLGPPEPPQRCFYTPGTRTGRARTSLAGVCEDFRAVPPPYPSPETGFEFECRS